MEMRALSGDVWQAVVVLAPAVVTVGATAADTEEIVGPVVSDLFVSVLVAEPP